MTKRNPAGTASQHRACRRQVFGAVTRAKIDITALIKRTLETVGRIDATEVTAFTALPSRPARVRTRQFALGSD